MRILRVLACALIPAWLIVGCATEPGGVCSPGASVSCVGAGGCAGGQVCLADGSGYGTCDCAAVDAGADSGADGGAPMDGGVDASAEDLNDAASDSGPISCDPFTHVGCAAAERCAWVRITETIGEARCVADGTVGEGGACTNGTPGPTTGFDDCRRGLVCASSTCMPVCEVAAPAGCGPAGECTRYAGLFASGEDEAAYGACTPSCDPLTQLTSEGTSCGEGMGCYGVFGRDNTSFVCATAGSVGIGESFAGTALANICVPGGYPSRRGDGTRYCAPFCRPAETHSGATAAAAGLSPYSCPEVGASSPPNECVFAWIVSPMDPPPARLNALGVCFDRTGRQYDSNGDGSLDTPWPSCTELSNTDTDGDGVPQHREFGCAPRP